MAINMPAIVTGGDATSVFQDFKQTFLFFPKEMS